MQLTMEIKDVLKISDEFTKAPGARYLGDGNFTGQDFLTKLLKPRFEKAVSENYILLIDLEDLYGFPASFVSGSFGKLSLEKGHGIILKHIKFKSDDNPLREEKAIREISSPQKRKS